MSAIMTATQIPAHLFEAVTMPLEELAKVINGEEQTAMRLTRTNLTVLRQVLEARTENRFDYEQFALEELPEIIVISDSEMGDDDDIVIMMNDFIASPVYHREFYVTTPESSDNENLSDEIERIQSSDSSRASISEDQYMANLEDFCAKIMNKDLDQIQD